MNPFTIIPAKQTGFKCTCHLDRLTFGNLSIDVAVAHHMNKVGPYTFSLSHRASSQSVIMCYRSLVLLTVTHCTYNFHFSRNLYNGDCWLWIIQFSFTGYFVFCLSIWKSSTWVENVLSSFFELKWKGESQSYYSACLFWNHHVFCPRKIERQLWYVFVILLNRLRRSRFMKSTQRLTFYQSWIIYFLIFRTLFVDCLLDFGTQSMINKSDIKRCSDQHLISFNVVYAFVQTTRRKNQLSTLVISQLMKRANWRTHTSHSGAGGKGLHL